MKTKKEVIRKLIALLLVCIMLVSMAACGKGGSSTPVSSGNDSGSSGNSSPASGKDTVKVGVTADAGTLHPHQNTAIVDLYGAVNGLIYEPLWTVDSEENIVYLLATGYEITGPNTMRITLREGVTFANGETFDAEDALFSLISWNHREGQPAMFANLDEEASKVIDPYTIELVMTEMRINSLVGIGQYSMFDKETYDADALAMKPNGTGPYVVEKYVVNSHLHLTLRDDYWGTTPKIKNFRFVQLKEDLQRVNALEAGEVDVISLPFQDVDYVMALPDIKVDVFPSVDAQALLFNISPSSVFYENRDARLAVAHAIDRDAIVKNVFYDYAMKSRMPATASCLDVDERFFNMGAYGPDGYNPELAKELAVSSGLVNEEILLINNGRSELALMCELIQANLKEIGVNCKVLTLDIGSWADTLFDETKWDMAIDFSWAESFMYSSNLQYMLKWMSAESYYNYQWDGHDRVFYLLDEAPTRLISMIDEKERIELNLEITKLVVNEMLWFSIIDEMRCRAFRSDLKGNVKNIEGEMMLYRNFYWE